MKKASIRERVLISWVIVAVIFFIIGFGIGWGCRVLHKGLAQKPEAEKALVYGRYDGIIFEGEIMEVKDDDDDDDDDDDEFVLLDVPISEDLQKFIFYLSKGYEIDFTFVMALIQQESSFRVNVISESKDYGLMQINEINHALITETLGVADFLEPYNNIRSGMFILRKLFEKYKTPEKVLMAYNLGESGAVRLWEKGIFEINYSKSVFQYQQQFNEEIERRKEE
jgi:hypothetical protein